MKTLLLFSIIACLVGFSVILYSEAIPWTSEENMALGADAMAVGRITSYRDEGAHRYYEISIIKWIKNPQADQTITMRSITPKVFDPHNPYAIFQKKDLGLFYLKSVDGEWRSTNYSKQIWAIDLNQTIHYMKKLVGNNNPDSSVSLERTCKEGYVNAVKNRTGEIACVKPQTLQKLRERGWAEPLGNVIFQRPSENSLIPANSWDDTGKFAENLVKITNDVIIEKRIDDESHAVFTTQKGNLIISKENSLQYSKLVDYSLQGNYAIPKKDAAEFVNDFLDKIGYQRDGSEWVENTDYGSYLKIQYQQRKDGWIINNEITEFTFWPDSTYIYLGRWYHNIDGVKLQYSQDDAKKIAYDHAKSLNVQELQECDFVAVSPESARMEIISGSFVYSLASGSCKKEAWEGHYQYIEVLVGAVDGNVVGWRYGPLE